MDITKENIEASEFGKFSETEITALKAKHGKRLRYLKVTTDDGISEFIIKKPNRATSMAVKESLDKKNEEGAASIMLANCVIAGDIEDIEDDAEVLTKVTSFITGLVNKGEISAKKL